jgi:hypothetical protein
MPKICYEKKKFSAGSLKTIKTANEILLDYASQGYDLTLRQLYYQFVSRGLIENKDTEYKRLGSTINDARLAGLIDWNHITDRTRNMRENAHWEDPQSIVTACAKQFQIDKWDSQDNYVEVWVEKDALVGVLEVACKPLDVPYFSCRGYTSQSEMWSAGQRLITKLRAGKKVHIIHLGDHDPSGIDMTRDIQDRLQKFATHHIAKDWLNANAQGTEESKEEWVDRCKEGMADSVINVNRIALNMEQIRQYNPPPNPAKLTDSRATSYIREYGDESWELDALEPSVLTALIESAVAELRDEDAWARDLDVEQDHKDKLAAVASKWDDLAV